jgi:acyl-CoA thioester hydrolase
VVYHGNYAQYFEMGRGNGLETLGFHTNGWNGIMLPVVSLNINYKKTSPL